MAVENGYYQTLKRKLVLIVILVSFTPLLMVSGIMLGQFYISYHEKVHDHLGELVQKHQQNIDTFFQDKLSDIKCLATNRPFRDLSNESFPAQTLARLQQEFGLRFSGPGRCQ